MKYGFYLAAMAFFFAAGLTDNGLLSVVATANMAVAYLWPDRQDDEDQ
jgi:hypothetical protein